MLKFARLKKRFDVKQMQQEVCAIESALWEPHYNTKHYEGTWTTLQLRSINGNIENGVSIHGSSLQENMSYKDTILLEKCLYLKSVINFFSCEKMSVRLMNLNAGSIIKEHTDFDMNFEKGEARFHIPLFTNPGVSFFIEDEKILMKEGECWYLNLSLKHKVNNFGDANRIHLVIDCKVNDWIKKLLKDDAELTVSVDEKNEENNYSVPEKIKIIEQLRIMNTATSNELADKMEAGIII
ncbi:MAG: aspartyl/asparaginyl beta-hydroxylase domain-containing protein [Ginsengibacter sp.]